MTQRRAFTLIELLVVIAIIAILAAILFPVFAQAKSAAKKTTSASNEKQISLGLMMYMTDFDDGIPQSQYGVDAYQVAWPAMIYPYIKSGRKGTSSAGVFQAWGEDGLWKVPDFPGEQSFNYGVHLDLFPDNWGATNPGRPTYSMGVIDQTSDKILLVEKGRTEATWGWCYFATWEWDWTGWTGYDRNTGTVQQDRAEVADTFDCDGTGTAGAVWAGCGMHPRYRYSRNGNMLFADGHVKSKAKGSLKWFTNIFVKGVGDFQRNGNESWYPY